MAGFSVVDYVIFGIFIMMSVSIGIFHAWKARRRQRLKTHESSTADFLMGSRKMPILPTALSVLTTFISGISLLGTPAEIYQRGLLIWVQYLMGIVALLISGFFFLPIFFRFQPTSIYEYFEHRFESRAMRRIGAALFLLNTLVYMSIVMYAPAVALSGVAGSPTWIFILSVGAACTLYTTLGGIKAVVWADTLQSGFMYVGLLIVIIKGTIDVGGISRVFEISSEYHRIEPLTYVDPNPAQHFSLLISLFGGVAFWMSLYGLNQMAIQRYCSLPSFYHAKIVIGITVPAFLVLGGLCCYIGLLMFAYFYQCDPLQTGEATKPDQLVIIFVIQLLGSLSGLPGLFLACLFSGTLSTVSSGMNSMAAVMWEDFLKQKFEPKMTDARITILNKVLVIIFGIIATGLAFAAGPMGGIINACFSMMGALAGPLIGLFILGVFVPSANKVGAFAGVAASAVVALWLSIGSFVTKPYAGYVLPTNHSCGDSGFSDPTENFTYNPHYGNPDVFYAYRISPFLYALIGILVLHIVAVPVSYLTQKFHGKQEQAAARVNRKFTLTFAGRVAPSFDLNDVKEETTM